ncbi:MAG: hypothetical protein PVG39_08495 [Desulfobacteraceae bacterium]|jgi:hypothetical protein
MGVKVRDVDDEFVGAPFRDEETKLLAYDYDSKYTIRVQAAKVKPALAELTMMESSRVHLQTGKFGSIPYSTGNSHNTWFACTLVDAEGKEIPWVDRDVKVLEKVKKGITTSQNKRPPIG